MEERINIAELLKGCPQGMELYSPIFGNVYLDKIRPHLAIVVTVDKKQGDFKEEFLYDGRYGMNGECMLFPSKGITTWEDFERPFKDNEDFSEHDIVTLVSKKGHRWICEYKSRKAYELFYYKGTYVVTEDGYKEKDLMYNSNYDISPTDIIRLATPEEAAIFNKHVQENKMPSVLAELLEHIKTTSKEELKREFKDLIEQCKELL